MSDRSRLQAALQVPNVRAFLRAIRIGEGTSDDRGYHRIVGGEEFEDFSHHPRHLVDVDRDGPGDGDGDGIADSTAAGAYQFIWPTWRGLVAQYGFPDFSPECQDEACVALIAEVHALDDVEAGRVVDAIQKCSAKWASLPGSTAGQRIERLDRVEAEYVKWGGTVAT